MNIDLVYLWVDGADAKWRAKKEAALNASRRALPTSSVSSHRWQDHNELKYGLRALEKFAPWINHIYIVTDNQHPAWLSNNPKVTIINQSEILEADKLPTFNSVHIEFFLYKIKNLSEHFLYANDDMIMNTPLSPDFFFDENGNPRVIIKERDNARAFRRRKVNGNWNNTKFNALNLIREKFRKKYNVTYKHCIEPIRKSYMRENAEKNWNEIAVPNMTTFREKTNVQRMVYCLLDNAQHRNQLFLNWRDGKKRIEYFVDKDSGFLRAAHGFRWLIATMFGYIKYDCYDKQPGIVHFIRKYMPKTFCINDSRNSRKKFIAVEKLFKDLFPNKSEFEL